MSMSDPISDLITRIRNAQMVQNATVTAPASKMKKQICHLLTDEGYIKSVSEKVDDNGHATIEIALKYYQKKPVITEIKRISTPGRRVYVGHKEIPTIYQGLGISVLSTNKGVITSRKARKLGVGGELLFSVF